MCKSTVDTSTMQCQCDKEKPPVDSLGKFLIWSKKYGGAWYRANSRGYVDNPDVAGRFTEDEATAIASGCKDLKAVTEFSAFAVCKRNDYMLKKLRLIRGCLETMTPQQVLELVPHFVSERIELQRRNGI